MIRKLKSSVLISRKPEESKIKKIEKTKIRVIGIGGGGGNIVSEIASKVRHASFVAANTDSQALKSLGKKVLTFQFGENLTRGLGAGMNPQLGELAAQEAKERIKKLLQGQDLVILIATLGGGAGSGAVPVFAQIARGLQNLTLGIFTLPFDFEGSRKIEIAKTALAKLRPKLNAFVLLPNEQIFRIIEKTTPLNKAFLDINKILASSLEGLLATVFEPGLINIDFADLRTILSGQGKLAYLNAVGVQKSENSTKECIEKVLNSPLYPYNIKGARGVLLNIAGEKNLELAEVSEISKTISSLANKDAKIIFGISQNKKYQNSISAILLAVGCSLKIFNEKPKKKKVKENYPEEKKLTPDKLEKPEKSVPKKIKIIIPKAKKQDKVEEKTEKDETKIRKNALQIKQENEEEEAKMLAGEEFWQAPAFLRKK